MSRASRRGGGKRPLKRKVATRTPKRTFVIFCEGVRTEPQYLTAVRRDPQIFDSAAVEIQIVPGGVPVTLVSKAREERRKALDENAELDEFWCVFDVEWPLHHPGLAGALHDAAQNDIRVAVTNPCFELWLILHFQDQTAFLDTAQAVRLRGTLDGSQGKDLDPAQYMPRVQDALRRARELDKIHERDQTRFPHNNPSSGMHLLMTALSKEVTS